MWQLPVLRLASVVAPTELVAQAPSLPWGWDWVVTELGWTMVEVGLAESESAAALGLLMRGAQELPQLAGDIHVETLPCYMHLSPPALPPPESQGSR